MELPIFDAALLAELSVNMCLASFAIPEAAPPMTPAIVATPPSE